MHLETGQETAEGLLQFIAGVERSNLFINFDPANMILYGTGEPIEALRKVGKYVRSIHCKDATWSDQPGVTWGLFWGSRSYNFHSLYGFGLGLFAQGRYSLGDSKAFDLVTGVQVDFAVVALPFLLLLNGVR